MDVLLKLLYYIGIAALIFILVFVANILYWVFPPSTTLRYKLTIVAEVDGQRRSGAGIFEIKYYRGGGGMGGGHTTFRGRGTSPIVDLGEHGWVFARLSLPLPWRHGVVVDGTKGAAGSAIGDLLDGRRASKYWPPPRLPPIEFIGSRTAPFIGWISPEGKEAVSLLIEGLSARTNGHAKLVSIVLEDTNEPVPSAHPNPPPWLIALRNGAHIPVPAVPGALEGYGPLPLNATEFDGPSPSR